MLVAPYYAKIWQIEKIQHGFSHFRTFSGGMRELQRASRALPTPSHLVLASMHGSPDGKIMFNKGSALVDLDVVLEAILPYFNGRIHFHTCQIGIAIDAVVSKLNASERLKAKLAVAPQSWRISGFVQDVSVLRDGQGFTVFDKFFAAVSGCG